MLFRPDCYNQPGHTISNSNRSLLSITATSILMSFTSVLSFLTTSGRRCNARIVHSGWNTSAFVTANERHAWSNPDSRRTS